MLCGWCVWTVVQSRSLILNPDCEGHLPDFDPAAHRHTFRGEERGRKGVCRCVCVQYVFSPVFGTHTHSGYVCLAVAFKVPTAGKGHTHTHTHSDTLSICSTHSLHTHPILSMSLKLVLWLQDKSTSDLLSVWAFLKDVSGARGGGRGSPRSSS